MCQLRSRRFACNNCGLIITLWSKYTCCPSLEDAERLNASPRASLQEGGPQGCKAMALTTGLDRLSYWLPWRWGTEHRELTSPAEGSQVSHGDGVCSSPVPLSSSPFPLLHIHWSLEALPSPTSKGCQDWGVMSENCPVKCESKPGRMLKDRKMEIMQKFKYHLKGVLVIIAHKFLWKIYYSLGNKLKLISVKTTS